MKYGSYFYLHTITHDNTKFCFYKFVFLWLYIHHRSPLNVVHAGLDILRSELKNSFPTAAGPTILFLNDLVWTHTYIHEYIKKEF